MNFDVNNRGIYLVRYTGEGQEDKKTEPGLLWLPKGCCKFGKSLNIKDVEKRYNTHCDNNVDVSLVGHFKDRDDIDAIEKALHKRFSSKRLINSRNRKSEWMQNIPETELRDAFIEVVSKHFKLWDKD
jgi:hypothetical protein